MSLYISCFISHSQLPPLHDSLELASRVRSQPKYRIKYTYLYLFLSPCLYIYNHVSFYLQTSWCQWTWVPPTASSPLWDPASTGSPSRRTSSTSGTSGLSTPGSYTHFIHNFIAPHIFRAILIRIIVKIMVSNHIK